MLCEWTPQILRDGEKRRSGNWSNTLRMRPDRIVLGEVRGAETLDMLQAMTTGQDRGLWQSFMPILLEIH